MATFLNLNERATEALLVCLIILAGLLALALCAMLGQYRLTRHHFEAVAHGLDEESRKRLSPVLAEMTGPQRGCRAVVVERFRRLCRLLLFVRASIEEQSPAEHGTLRVRAETVGRRLPPYQGGR